MPHAQSGAAGEGCSGPGLFQRARRAIINPHATCQTCLFNVDAHCACEDGRYKGSPVKSWNTCSTHKAPTPTPAELLARLVVCTAALSHLADKVSGEYRALYADRAEQCRSWVRHLKEGRADVDDIVGGLREFEQMAL